MWRIILAIIVGFIVWSAIWMVSDAVLMVISPDWYGKGLTEFQAAVNNRTPFEADWKVWLLNLARSVICSVISGYAAAWIARENVKSIYGLGILLFVVGILVESAFWNYVPLWYHLSFLLLLIPMTVLGGKLRKN